MEGPARMTVEPGADLRGLMGGIVVQDRLDELAARHSFLDRVEEADDLAVAVMLHAAADHLALLYVQSDKQGRRAMSLASMGARRPQARLHRQRVLRAGQRLDRRNRSRRDGRRGRIVRPTHRPRNARCSRGKPPRVAAPAPCEVERYLGRE